MSDGNDFNERNIAGFAEHRRKTSRTNPVLALTPTSRAEPRK